MKALAALRAAAEQGMREDAAPAHAAAREELLQRYRDAWIDHAHLQLNDPAPRGEPMGEADLPAIEWIAQLAAAGHAPAAAFLERVLQPRHLDRLFAVAPQRMAALSGVTKIARYLVSTELKKPAPDRQRLEPWLESAGFWLNGLRAALRDLDAVAGGATAADWAAVRGVLKEQADAGVEDIDLQNAGELLYRFGMQRLDQADEASQRAGHALLERAAVRGSRLAAGVLFEAGFKAAAKKPAFLEQWLASGKPLPESGRLPCLQLGAALERGVAGRPPDLEAALPWYERALGLKARFEAGKLNNEFCYYVATAFDRNYRSLCKLDDPELAMKWHERGLTAGDDRCCDSWLVACAKGEAGLAADPAAALERAQRFRRSGANLKGCRWRIMSGVRAMYAAAKAEADPARAAKWREAAAAIEND